MHGGVVSVAVVLVALLGTAPLADAVSSPPTLSTPSMAIAASPGAAGAHRVRLVVTLRYRMQCSYPGAGPVVVTFPSALQLPKQFASGTVKLARKAVAASTKGQNVTVTVPPHKGVLCSMLGPGSVTILFTRAAKLTNPARAGSYRFRATHGKHSFRAKLVVTPAA
jgi:hypothetical protein